MGVHSFLCSAFIDSSANKIHARRRENIQTAATISRVTLKIGLAFLKNAFSSHFVEEMDGYRIGCFTAM